MDLKCSISLSIHLLFTCSLCEVNYFSFIELIPLFHIVVAISLKPTPGLSLCFNQQYVCADPWNPDRIKCPKTNRLPSTWFAACARFCCLNSFSLFVFPPSSGSTPSQYAVSVLERKSQIGTSGQKSCCPVQTVGAVVSRHVWRFRFLGCSHKTEYSVVCAKTHVWAR